MSAARARTPHAGAAGIRLVSAPARPADLLAARRPRARPAHRPRRPHDVLVRDGEIAEIGAAGTLPAPDGAEVVDGDGRHLFPAFVDPHVHLRTPGQEHKEDLETGTRSAAAGGYCASSRCRTPSPVVDSRADPRRAARRRRARGARAGRLHAGDHPRPAGLAS